MTEEMTKKKRSRSEEKLRRECIQDCKDMIQEIDREIASHKRSIELFRKDLKWYKTLLKREEAE